MELDPLERRRLVRRFELRIRTLTRLDQRIEDVGHFQKAENLELGRESCDFYSLYFAVNQELGLKLVEGWERQRARRGFCAKEDANEEMEAVLNPTETTQDFCHRQVYTDYGEGDAGDYFHFSWTLSKWDTWN